MKSVSSGISIEAYAVKWWGMANSKLGRPVIRVLRLRNDWCELRHVVVQGRPLGSYVMPYWPVRSFVSVVKDPAEIAHRGFANFNIGDERRQDCFRIGHPRSSHRFSAASEGRFQLAHIKGGKVLRITNHGSGSALLIDHLFLLRNSDPWIEICVRARNLSEDVLRSLELGTGYSQSFNWSLFGAGDRNGYVPVQAPMSGSSARFFAYSEGDGRGYEFVPGLEAKLSYALSHEMNSWEVKVSKYRRSLRPGSSVMFRYYLRPLACLPNWVPGESLVPSIQPDELSFLQVVPLRWRSAPLPRSRAPLRTILQGIPRRYVRGMNLALAPSSKSVAELELLRNWGCNLVLTRLGTPRETRTFTSKAHSLGMEVFLQGKGSYEDGPPSFPGLESEEIEADELPDSYGQDEDHYHWHGIKASRSFEEDFGKELSRATKDEVATYWSRCFADKWRKVLLRVRRLKAGSGVWFYTPTPSIANVDPLDRYGTFMREVSRIGQPLTVLPFYYGTEYNQVEYMVHRWKEAGARRVVFLTMKGFMDRPSQFLRAITAARRAGADGVCGFHFAVGGEDPWQWKSVMLGAWVNFPTPELDALCLLEEPAVLVESLSSRPVKVMSTNVAVEAFVEKLDALLPLGAEISQDESQPGELPIAVGTKPSATMGSIKRRGRGLIEMKQGILRLIGTDLMGAKRAMTLLLRFAELARYETRGRGSPTEPAESGAGAWGLKQ